MRPPASKALIVMGVLAVGLGTVAWLASRDTARAIRRDDVYILRLVVVGRHHPCRFYKERFRPSDCPSPRAGTFQNTRPTWQGDSFARLIPIPLPRPVPQPAGCTRGQLLELGLHDGRTIRYGPCRIPRSLEPLRRTLDESFIPI